MACEISIIELRSQTYDESVELFHFFVFNKDIHIRYRWYDPLPPAEYREDTCCLKYRTDVWFQFAYFVKYKLSVMPLSMSHAPFRRMREECGRVLTELARTLKFESKTGPLPKTKVHRSTPRDIHHRASINDYDGA